MSDFMQSNAPEVLPSQLQDNKPQMQTPTKKKLNWKGFFVGIVIVIVIEFFAIHSLNSGNKQTIITRPKPTPTGASQKTNNATANWKTYTNNYFSLKYPPNWMTTSLIDFTRLKNEKKIVMIYDGKMNSYACNSDKQYPSRFVTISSVTSQNSPKNFALENNTWGNETLKAALAKEMNLKNYAINNASGVIYHENGECARGLIIALSHREKIFLLNISAVSLTKDLLIHQILSTFKFTN